MDVIEAELRAKPRRLKDAREQFLYFKVAQHGVKGLIHSYVKQYGDAVLFASGVAVELLGALDALDRARSLADKLRELMPVSDTETAGGQESSGGAVPTTRRR